MARACLWALFLSLVAHASYATAPPPPPAALSPSPVCMTTGPSHLLREALPFCGGKVGSPTCCTREQDAKLHGSFLDELKKHDYHDTLCRSTLKGAICAVCLPSSPAEPFRKTTARKNELSLPLRRAALSVSIHDLTSPSTKTPTLEWPPADDDDTASTTPKLLIGLITSVLTLLGGFITYKICKANLCNNQCCNNNQCCLCFP